MVDSWDGPEQLVSFGKNMEKLPTIILPASSEADAASASPRAGRSFPCSLWGGFDLEGLVAYENPPVCLSHRGVYDCILLVCLSRVPVNCMFYVCSFYRGLLGALGTAEDPNQQVSTTLRRHPPALPTASAAG